MLLADWELRTGDAFELVDQLDDSSVQLTVSSPPYNIGKRYERRVALGSTLAPCSGVTLKLFTKTARTGVVCWQVGDHVGDGVVLPLDCLFLPLFVEAGFLPGTGSSGTFATVSMPSGASPDATRRSSSLEGRRA